jgi:hypothetical protein
VFLFYKVRFIPSWDKVFISTLVGLILLICLLVSSGE